MDAIPRTGDVRFIVFGWWIRLIWGFTFRPKRLRLSRFYGHTLVAVRIYSFKKQPMGGRLVGVQWKRADERLAIDGRRAPA